MERRGSFYTKEQLDYFTEVMNIGAGNAAAAFSQLLKRNVDVNTPKVHIISEPLMAKRVFESAPDTLDVVSMKMIGDVAGGIYFVLLKGREAEVVAMMKEAFIKEGKYPDYIPKKDREFDTSVIAEIGNILAGVYFTAIFEFSRVRIYYTVPTVFAVSSSAFFDGLASESPENTVIVVVENEFMISERNISSCFLLKTTEGDVKKIMDSMKRNIK